VKIKLDENVPEQLAGALSELGHDADTVILEDLVGRDDDAVWLADQESRRFLITQDLDFSDIRKFTPGTHAGLGQRAGRHRPTAGASRGFVRTSACEG